MMCLLRRLPSSSTVVNVGPPYCTHPSPVAKFIEFSLFVVKLSWVSYSLSRNSLLVNKDNHRAAWCILRYSTRLSQPTSSRALKTRIRAQHISRIMLHSLWNSSPVSRKRCRSVCSGSKTLSNKLSRNYLHRHLSLKIHPKTSKTTKTYDHWTSAQNSFKGVSVTLVHQFQTAALAVLKQNNVRALDLRPELLQGRFCHARPPVSDHHSCCSQAERRLCTGPPPRFTTVQPVQELLQGCFCRARPPVSDHRSCCSQAERRLCTGPPPRFATVQAGHFCHACPPAGPRKYPRIGCQRWKL
ncbi:uncharacterized protein F5891DRAFT_207608 [Suillus fuscotomentosus]|uniref:Uncharacterized protein n=1 Tax=Suillus fuscotomentosus TaxID=1912939 RepID=A0AAD4EK33_9AGAM|nr:uncharacterized protein F5891DRAFT_207608 [Suillus fuscotomentosus]KAG1907644.1 hypothetical protein F5891DRAFT_207608 [Suillus fuscotomentosus]